MTTSSLDVRFYQTKNTNANTRILTKLLERSFQRNMRAVLRLPDVAMCAYYDELLWSYHPASFLPHGKEQDPEPELQPILITHLDHNPNLAKVLFIAGDFVENQILDDFSIVCYIFGNNNAIQKQRARAEWKRLKELLGNVVSSLTYHSAGIP